MTGFFITLEGIDGCGKSTQFDRLTGALREHGFAVTPTREPGGTEIGTRIRALMSEGHEALVARAEFLLMAADRAQDVSEIIRPALEAGHVVVADRYIDSSAAFQGYGRGLDVAMVDKINVFATGGLIPNLTILFELDLDVARARLHARLGQSRSEREQRGMKRFDEEGPGFHLRVRDGYRKLASDNPDRIVTVDASGSVEGTHRRVMELVLPRLIER
jgi:dTMP kinase